MKQTSLSIILVFSLLGAPVPAQANNGMTSMMRLMMEMFLWMMGGGGGSGMSPYSMGGMGNPMLAGSMLGNPLLGNSMLGGANGWGNGFPYNAQGRYSNPAYSGFSPYGNLNGAPYNSPYYGNYNGNQSFYGQGYNPYAPNYYDANSPYGSPYRPSPYSRPGYNQYGARPLLPGQAAPVVIQPIVLSSERQLPADVQKTAASKPNISVEALPPVTTLPTITAPKTSGYEYNHDRERHDRERAYQAYDNPLYGRWQGVNGEYLELASDNFRLRSKDTDMQGTYQLKNNILKAAIPNREDPVYMQYHLADGYLAFRSEDGQTMLFRRLPQNQTGFSAR